MHAVGGGDVNVDGGLEDGAAVEDEVEAAADFIYLGLAPRAEERVLARRVK